MKKHLLLCLLVLSAAPSFCQTVILSSDFTSASGWSGWNINSNYFSHYLTIPPHGSIAYLCEGDGDDSYYQLKLISPSMDLSSFSSAYVAFSVYFFGQTYGGKTESLQLLTSTNGGSTWTVVKNIPGNILWHREYADISALSGNANVKIALQYSDDNGWLYGAGIDDVLVSTMLTNDAALMKINKQDFWKVNQPYTMKILLQNYGTDTITSAVVNYSVDGGTVQTDNISGLNLATLDTISFIHPVFWIPSAGSHDVTVWIESVNGLADQNNSNDALNFVLRNTVSSVPQKKILIDWAKATWCSLCPHGASIIDSIVSDHPGLVVPVNMHEILMGPDDIFDSLYTGSYSYTAADDDYYNSFLNDVPWLSRGYIDKYDFEEIYGNCVERLEMHQMADERLNYVPPVSVSASFTIDTLNMMIDADITADFFTDLQGDFRFNCLILKDSVSFNQDNWFTTYNRWPYCSPLSSIPWIHDNIFIQSLGGAYGTEGSIPASVTDGGSYSWHYHDTLKSRLQNVKNLSIAFMVAEYDSVNNASVVLNCGKFPVDTASSGIHQLYTDDEFSVFPNPASDRIFVGYNSNDEITLTFSDIQGSLLYDYYGKITDDFYLDVSKFPSGIYLLKITDSRKKVNAVRKIIKLQAADKIY